MSDVKTYTGLKMVALSRLKPYGNNSRTHSPDQVSQIIASIETFGFTNPILIADDHTIIAGHGRYMAAEVMGMKRVPCLKLSGLTEDQRRAYVITDNKLAEQAGWDKELLELELGSLDRADFDLGLLGFNEKELEKLTEAEPEPGSQIAPKDSDELAVVVSCADEVEQQAAYDLLAAHGYPRSRRGARLSGLCLCGAQDHKRQHLALTQTHDIEG